MDKPTSIDEYISQFSEELQVLLQQMRETIAKAAPEAEECINYGMPTFRFNGNLVHFAGFKNHIGFYPAPSGISNFAQELSPYKSSKGAVQFPLDQPLPLNLVAEITRFRVEENGQKKKK